MHPFAAPLTGFVAQPLDPLLDEPAAHFRTVCGSQFNSAAIYRCRARHRGETLRQPTVLPWAATRTRQDIVKRME
jgi:hypothetical protein